MAYNIMKNLVVNSRKSNDELSNMADVYFAAGRLTEEQYAEIISLIKER